MCNVASTSARNNRCVEKSQNMHRRFLLPISPFRKTFQDDETTSVKDCSESFKKPRNVLNVLIPLHTWDICFPPVIHFVHKLKGTLFNQLWQIQWEIRRTSVCKCFMLVCLIYAADRVVQQGVVSDVV